MWEMWGKNNKPWLFWLIWNASACILNYVVVEYNSKAGMMNMIACVVSGLATFLILYIMWKEGEFHA